MSALQKIFFFFSIFFISLAIPVVALADAGPLGGTIQTGQSNCDEGKYDTCLDPKATCYTDQNCGTTDSCSQYPKCALLNSPNRDVCEGHDPNDSTGKVETGICYYSTTSSPSVKDCGTITSLDYHQNKNYHMIKDDVQQCGPGFNKFVECCAPDNQPSPVAPPPPCVTGPDGACHQVDTGLGMIQVDPSSIVGSLFRVILGLSGGIAVILVIISGYRLMFSRGDPEKLKGAQEMLISAIIGLLFIIFSIVIIEIIGVDILHLPGLNR